MPYLPTTDSNKKPCYEFLEQELNDIQRMASVGMSIREISRVLFIAENTFKKILDKDRQEIESFEGSRMRKKELEITNLWARFNNGKKMYDAMIMQGLAKKAKDGNLTALMFLARAKLGWNDRIIETSDNETEEVTEIQVNFIEPPK